MRSVGRNGALHTVDRYTSSLGASQPGALLYTPRVRACVRVCVCVCVCALMLSLPPFLHLARLALLCCTAVREAVLTTTVRLRFHRRSAPFD